VGDELQLQELSEQRVEAVKNYLVEKGIDKNRISGKGFGGTQPISTGDTEADHAKNRRIEFEIIH
jgi:outer membrane protein OmpA-like peptidoglycan-associated protein